MDHIPLPRDPVRSPPRIRYYCLEEYDKGDFNTYPERLGLKQEDIITQSTRVDADGANGRGGAALLQQWLFFGLLHAAFGDAIVFEDFINEEGSTKYVHTRNLLAYTDQHVSKRKSGLLTENDMLRLERSLKTAYVTCRYFSSMPAPTLDPYFLLSLLLLGQFLTDREIFMNQKENLIWKPPFLAYKTDLLQHEMIEQGWCPRAVRKSQKLLALDYSYFTSFLRNLRNDRHHGACTNTQCLASQIQKSSYRTAHSSDGCGCSFQGFDQATVEKVLDAGLLPLVAWDRSNGVVKLISGTFDATYVAISHVWSDGLGNPHANTMPSCQLEVLNDLVQNLYPGEASQVPFWIDTLCCPAISSNAKRIAIRKMRDTYACANKVLVLDNALRSVDVTGRSVVELAFYIHYSDWCSRLWTFQEGALPETLIFQFLNGTLDSEEIVSTTSESYYSLKIGCVGATDLLNVYGSFRGTQKRSKNPYKVPVMDIGHCVVALATRTTSVQGDESLCLAGLTDIDPAPLLSVNPRDRMLQFWARLSHIPEKLMYYPHSRIDSMGFRWAPKTLLGIENDIWYWDAHATPTAKGLLVNAYSITLRSPNFPLSHPIDQNTWIRGTDDHWRYYLSKSNETIAAQGYNHFTVPEGHFSRIALLMTSRILSSSVERDTRFVMVFVTEEHDEVTYARRADSGWINDSSKPSGKGNAYHTLMIAIREFLLKEKSDLVTKEGENYLFKGQYTAFVGDWTDEKSKWCID